MVVSGVMGSMTIGFASEVGRWAEELRSVAEDGPVGRRHSSRELYDLLGRCMSLAEFCVQGEANTEMRRLVLERSTQGRRYVEKGSDSYLLVCRFVFGSAKSASAERSNASRYAHALRIAHKNNLAPQQLSNWLFSNGGVNALYLKRAVSRRDIKTKCLHLTSQITVPKGEEFTLKLIRNEDNTYTVIEDGGSDEARAA